MKLNKANLQKLVLGVIIVIVGVYFYFSELLGPLSVHEADALDSISKLEPQIKDAQAQINRTKSLEAGDVNAAVAREIFAVMKTTIPEEPPVAWYQPKLTDFFKQQGIEKATCRWNSDAPQPDLPGYKSCAWSIDLPKVEYATLGTVLANLENREGLLQITNLLIEASAGPDVLRQHVQLTVSTIVKEVKQ